MKTNGALVDIMQNPILTLEFLDFFTGPYLAEGQMRYVFQHPLKKNWVIKIDHSEYNANVTEFNIWNDVKDTRIAEYFAPVIEMSNSGRILVMTKADMNRPIGEYWETIPSFFCDVKKTNFGFINGSMVCVDYGINDLVKTGIKGWRWVKAKW